MTHNYDPSLSADLFAPAPAATNSSEIISRPTLTYWQDARLRLSKDRTAIICFSFISFILIIGIAAPWFFPDAVNGVAYYNLQSPDAIDQGPTGGTSLLIVEDYPPTPEPKVDSSIDLNAALLNPSALIPPTSFTIDGTATVSGVSLHWSPVVGVSGYLIFRTTFDSETDVASLKSGLMQRGVLVGEVNSAAQISFVDSMGLDPSQPYVYSIVSYAQLPESSEPFLSSEAAVVTTELIKTIALSDAQLIHPSAQLGEIVQGRPHLFGTDGLGRDVLARMITGTRVDMLLALFVPLVSILVGLVYGSISGLLGKKTDLVMMRIVEIVDNFPDILFFILLQVAIGKGLFSLFLAMTSFGWAGIARIVRGEVLRLREIEFVQASRLLGASLFRIVQKHLAPNLLGIIIIAWSARIPLVISLETFLSLLGLGIEQPNPSWGNVVFDASRRLQVNPVQFFLPATVLGLTLLAFYLLGNSLRDAFDPNLRGRG